MLLHWALQTLGYSAAFQGRPDDAERCFDEAAHVDLPVGTLSANKTTEARSAFRRGDRARAFRLLLSYVEELIDTDNVIAASVVSIEFINMAATVGRTAGAAHLLHYLAAANDFGALAARTRVTTFDYRDMGLSFRAPGPSSETDDIAAVLDAAGVDAAVLVGVSDGARRALTFAHRHPGRVRRVVAVGGAFGEFPDPGPEESAAR